MANRVMISSGPTRYLFHLWNLVKQEPLVRFVVIAALLFAASEMFGADRREAITVDQATQNYLVQRREELLRTSLDEQEKADLIENFIEEEILVREARRMGLTNNSRIRSLLVRNMRFFLTSDIEEPSDEELQAFFDKNADRFSSEPSITFEHAFYSDPEAVPADTLDRLQAGADHRSMGDTTSLNAELVKVRESQIDQRFGREQAQLILDSNRGDWSGPFTTAEGVHFVRLVERHPSRRPSFEDAKAWLTQEWALARSREIIEREVSKMRQNYRIKILQDVN